jgi:hypothetical protein
LGTTDDCFALIIMRNTSSCVHTKVRDWDETVTAWPWFI